MRGAASQRDIRRRSMNRRIAMAGALVLALGALPLVAQGQGQGQRPGGPGGPGRGGPGGPMGILPGLNEVGLTDAQREQIRGILDAERQAGTDPAATGRQAEQALLAAVLADVPKTQAIESGKTAGATARARGLHPPIELMQKGAEGATPPPRQPPRPPPPP